MAFYVESLVSHGCNGTRMHRDEMEMEEKVVIQRIKPLFSLFFLFAFAV